MVAPANATPKAQALIRGFNRAAGEKLVIFRISPILLGVASVAGGWQTKPYTLQITGSRPQDCQCSCPAGTRGLECKHRALAVYCRRHNVYALKPQAPVVDPLASLFE